MYVQCACALGDICFLFVVCFRVFDSDGDGFLSRSEIELMCKALIEIRKENAGEKVITHVLSTLICCWLVARCLSFK